MLRFHHSLLTLIAALSVVHAAAAQEVIHRSLTPEQTEEILKKFEFNYKRLPEAVKEVSVFELTLGKLKVRLSNFLGKDVMIEAAFPKVPLEQINLWNVQTKFTRASMQRGDKDEFVNLEYNLDLTGGITEGAFKSMIVNFEAELGRYQRFYSGYLKDDVLYMNVTAEKLEGVFDSLNIPFKKAEDKSAAVYEYKLDKISYRLVNRGGKELVVAADFPKAPLERLNTYNFNHKFTRAVLNKSGDQEYTTLETPLDCEAGVTDAILRNFIVSFEAETKSFIQFLRGK
jgi:hypothetical protein